MATIERGSVLSLAFEEPLGACPCDAGQAICPTARLYRPDDGRLLLAAIICWGLAPLLIMGLLLAGEATRLVRDTLGMAGPGGDL